MATNVDLIYTCCKGGRWRFGKIEILLKLWIVFIIDQELIYWSKGDKTHLLYTFSRSVLDSKFILRFARNKVGLRIKKTRDNNQMSGPRLAARSVGINISKGNSIECNIWCER
jgi:hypothetical protein